jgi:hypothetical protein
VQIKCYCKKQLKDDKIQRPPANRRANAIILSRSASLLGKSSPGGTENCESEVRGGRLAEEEKFRFITRFGPTAVPFPRNGGAPERTARRSLGLSASKVPVPTPPFKPSSDSSKEPMPKSPVPSLQSPQVAAPLKKMGTFWDGTTIEQTMGAHAKGIGGQRAVQRVEGTVQGKITAKH